MVARSGAGETEGSRVSELRKRLRGLTEMPEGSKRHSVFLSPDWGKLSRRKRLKCSLKIQMCDK